MNGLAHALVILLLLVGAGTLVVPWLLGRITRLFNRHESKPDEATFLLSTVNDLVSGIRESETGLRDLYSQAEKKASFLEHYHRGILESMRTGVLACNRRGEVTAMNEAAGAILGRPTVASPGTKLDALLGGSHPITQALETVVRGEPPPDRVELRLPGKGEEARWIEVRTSILHGKSGQPVGATFLLDDVTERKILRRQVELKTRLAAMGEISAGITHEFRNAVHALSGLAKLISRRAEGNERIAPLAREILGETKQMATILEELRTFLGPQRISPERFAPAEWIRSVLLPFLEDQAGSRPVRIQLALKPDLPMIRADRTLLSQAIRNLVRNAIQAMPDGGTLTVRAAVLSPRRSPALLGGGAHFLLAVSDTGPGIDDEVRRRIFTPFFTTRPDGTGLGLPFVQKVMAAHGGSVDLETSPGGGTTFTLYLPVAAPVPESSGTARTV